MKSLAVLVFCAVCLLATPVLALQQDADATWGRQDEDSQFWTCEFPGFPLRYETYEPPKDLEYASFGQFPLFETSFLSEVQNGGRELQFD